MKYFAIHDNDGKLTMFGTTSAQTVKGEITEAEYNDLMLTYQLKVDYAEKVHSGEIAFDNVPEKYREDVAQMVEDMSIVIEPVADPEVDEALAILRGEVSE